MKTIKVLQVGMGPLGIKMAEYIAQRSGITSVAALDKNPDLIGKNLSQLSEALSTDVVISDDLSAIVKATQPDVALLTTVSDMVRITPQIEALMAEGIPVVSTCEELSFPWDTSEELANTLDEVAKKKGVAVLGTGVNPGFQMDALPSFLTAVCQSVESVEVRRFQDATFRRVPFQNKIGAGLDLDAFEQKKADGSLRHVGLTESMQFIAGQLGWKLDRTEDVISPAIAGNDITSGAKPITKGQASGVTQVGRGWVNGEEKIKLVFQAAVGEKESYDEVIIKGEPNIHSRIAGGVNGDVATCAISINAIASVLKATPGLHTMATVPMVSCFGG